MIPSGAGPSDESSGPPDENASAPRAVIFDFDGVIADTETLHWETFSATLEAAGVPLRPDLGRDDFLGIHDRGCFRIALEAAGMHADDGLVDELVERKSVLYADGIGEVRLFPGAERVLRESVERGPSTIASGGRRIDIERVLGRHGLSRLVPRFISADEVSEAKPSPACFLAALELLREAWGEPLAAGDCLVFEDSVRGVTAALRAGMRCVALANSYPREALAHAHRIVDSLADWRWSTP